MAMLDFDMLGSPNFVRFVYDGDNSAFPVGPGVAAGPPGSAFIEDLFTDYFNSASLATDPTAFDGRSDYGPFIAVGIPAGGVFAGAEGIKASLHGKNPVWAAIKGAWQAGTPVVRAAIIAAAASAILLLLLSPVLLLVFLVSLLIIAAVHRARAGKP